MRCVARLLPFLVEADLQVGLESFLVEADLQVGL